MECDEHLVCSSPKISPTRKDIIVQENDIIDTCLSNNSNVASLDGDDEVTLDSHSLKYHHNEDRYVEVMNIRYPLSSPTIPLIIGPPKSSPE